MSNLTPRALVNRWSKVLNEESAGQIKDNHKKFVTAQILENTKDMLLQERGMLSEAPNTVGGLTGAPGDALTGSGLDATPETGGLAGFDPVLMGLVRRAMPNLMAYDICGVQPMSGPTGLIFAMKSHYQTDTGGLRGGPEALYNEPDMNFSADTGGSAAYTQAEDGSGEGAAPLGTVNPSTPNANPGLLNDTTGNSSYPDYDGSNAGYDCLLYTSPSPRDLSTSRMPSSA